ncbi:MAG: glycosyltransferase family 39 protein [Anaerolineae bacterium]|nr:glycosyltransferase family 39 protein [Phycisphaerae bacterium]
MSAALPNFDRPARGWIALSLILLTLLGAGFRLASVHDFVSDKPNDPSRLVGDEQGYESLAYGVTQGDFFTWEGRVPGYPLVIAATYKLVGARSLNAALYAQAMLSALTIPLTFLLSRFFVRARPAFGAAVIVACDPALIAHARSMYTEALYTPLVVVCVIAMQWAVRSPAMLRFATAGIALAMLNLTRPTGALMPVIWLIGSPWNWSIGRRIGATIVCGLAMALCIAPWTLHNWRTHHQFIPLASSTSVLWQGSPEYYHLTKTKSYANIWQEDLNAAHNGGHNPFTIEGERHFNQRAIASIKSKPFVYAKYCAKKFVYFWFGNPMQEYSYAQVMDRDYMRDRVTNGRWFEMIVGRNFVWPGVLALMILIARRRVMIFALPLAVIAYYWGIHTLTVAEVRFSEPLHPLVAVIIVGAIARLTSSERTSD